MTVGDWSWVHNIIPYTKLEQWSIHYHQPFKNIKFSMQWTNVLGYKRCVVVDLIPHGSTVNTLRYCETLDKDVYVRVSYCCIIIPLHTWPTWEKNGFSHMTGMFLLHPLGFFRLSVCDHQMTFIQKMILHTIVAERQRWL